MRDDHKRLRKVDAHIIESHSHPTNRRPLTYSARLVGSVNDRPLRVRGRGSIDHHAGRVRGMYRLDQIPVGIHPRFLNAVMVTGYPSVCQESSDAANPFVNGPYSYTRTLDFGSRGKLTYTAKCHGVETEPDSNTLESYFEIVGTVDIPPLVRTAPVVETWTPTLNRTIDGCFTMAWECENGGYVNAIARTEYLIPEGSSIPTRVLYRCIELTNFLDDEGVLEIDQHSRLYSEQSSVNLARGAAT